MNCIVLLVICLASFSRTCEAAAERNDEFEFFEKRIRPVLIEHCYECHNSADTMEGGLAVDSREALREGGFSGPTIIPGKPAESQLLQILRHEIEGLEMPSGGPKLDERTVKDFEQWIADGASDPRNAPPSAEEIEEATSWAAMLERRKQWWSFQPIVRSSPPEQHESNVSSLLSSRSEIDRFIGTKLQEAGLESATPATPETLVRRLYFTLVGLPPSHEEALAWTERIQQNKGEERDAVIASLVDELLDSPRYGEHWARHWMDWIRYAESHGSEGDPVNANAWMYRDYLIRALNQDVSYDQLVREHIAGDLLESPRTNQDLGINESIIGTAHWRMVFHGFAPTDALDEKVRFIDDEINAFSKAFLGLTVSCARCHNHKFDAISQADYYALFGILGSCRPGRAVIETLPRQQLHQAELGSLKESLRKRIATEWLTATHDWIKRVRNEPTLIASANTPDMLLHVVRLVDQATESGSSFDEAWQQQSDRLEELAQQWNELNNIATRAKWNLASEGDYRNWYRTGIGLPASPASAGEWSIASQGDKIVTGIYPAGAYSHRFSDKHAARLSSPDIGLDGEYEVWLQAIGSPSASFRYVVQDYPRSGTVYPVQKLADSWQWQRIDLSYWQGDQIHLEVTTARDAPLLVENQDRSWIGVRQALIVKKGIHSPPPLLQHLLPLYQLTKNNSPESRDALIQLVQGSLTDAIEAWREGVITDEQALLLDAAIRQQVLPNTTDKLPSVAALVSRYRDLESDIPVPTRVPTLTETEPRDQPLFIRGNHKKLGDPVPRRFLEAIDSTRYSNENSGRLQLAQDLLREDNPLMRRVIVNRVWHHVFGQGIVATPDNFGRLGDRPSHPELLDWLAVQFVDDDWSLKQLIRKMVTSRTWQLDSIPTDRSMQIDPENRLLSHANVRRLQAEAIRDAILQVAGKLEHQLGGEPARGDTARRSIYLAVIRNSLNPFLRAFDFPEPYTTVGRRDVTNVPAQSLTLMNDPQVAAAAAAWAKQTLTRVNNASSPSRINRMFLDAFGRRADEYELRRSEDFLQQRRAWLEQRIADASKLRQEVKACQQAIDAIKDPVRHAIVAERQEDGPTDVVRTLNPIAAWDFTQSLEDQVGDADVILHGQAKLQSEGLELNGGFGLTQSISHSLSEKTMEVWVQLDNLQQQGGGVITIQSPSGNEFDAIVFGEKTPGHWLAGSEFFHRTQAFDGPVEETASVEPVHLAFVYTADGRITAYRNGTPYGKSYVVQQPKHFDEHQYVVGFGIRHLPSGGNKQLHGSILNARLYDRALTEEEISHSANGTGTFVSEKEILSRLTDDDRTRLSQQQQQLTELSNELHQYDATPTNADELTLWSEFARALFTVKEFIYVR